MSLEKCKELLEEVSKLCASMGNPIGATSEASSSQVPSRPASRPASCPPPVSSAPPVPPAQPSPSNSALLVPGIAFQEHQRLFGFNSSAPKRKRERESSRYKSSKRPKQPPTWTRKFVCLANTDEDRMPCSQEYRELLGEKHLTFLLDDYSIAFNRKLREAFPKLEEAGGYTLLCGSNTRQLQVLNPPYGVPKLKELVGQGKVFVRPLQRDLDLTPNAVPEEEVRHNFWGAVSFFFSAEHGGSSIITLSYSLLVDILPCALHVVVYKDVSPAQQIFIRFFKSLIELQHTKTDCSANFC